MLTFIATNKNGETIQFEADSSYDAMHWVIKHCDMSQEPWTYEEKK